MHGAFGAPRHAATRPRARSGAGLLARWLALAACLALTGCETLSFAALNSTDARAGIDATPGLVFDSAHHLRLDVYAPAYARHAPVVVFFYGGSWVRGERGWYRYVGTALAAHGVVAVIPDYRKFPAVGWRDFMRDAADAVRYARDHAASFGGDPHDLFVMGHSSGGHIAALLATDPHWLGTVGMRPRQLAGFIGLAGVYAFVPLPPQEKGMLAIFGRAPAMQRQAEPVAYVDGHEPPMLLLYGTSDREVDPSNSIALAAAMRAHGETVELKGYPEVGHMALALSLSRPLRKHAPVLSDVLAFIHAHPVAELP